MTGRSAVLAAALGTLLAAPVAAEVRTPPGKMLEQVGFDQRLGESVPLNLVFRDETGRPVPLRAFFGRKPVILAPVYYNCPMLCTQTLNGLTRALKPLAPSMGTDFEVIVLSIDPSETSELARQKKAAYLRRYDRPGAEAGFHFLTGEPEAIAALTRAIGFRSTYNPQTRQYAHAAGIVVISPQGRLATYFYGVEYSPRDLQFALTEAASGRIGRALAWLPLLCYDYDAATGRYTLSILRLSRVLGTATAVGLVVVVGTLLLRERRLRAASPAAAQASPAP